MNTLPEDIQDIIDKYKHQMEFKDVMEQLKDVMDSNGCVCYCGRWTLTTCDCECDWSDDWSEGGSDISFQSDFSLTMY